MKKLSKIVALLLAGAMAMVLFTACSGGGAPEAPGNPKEQEMMQTIKQSSQGKGIKENDPGLYQTALSDLNTDFEAQSKKGGAFIGRVRVNGIKPAEENVTITVTADYKVGQFLTNLLDFISANIGITYPGANVDFRSNSSWSKAAVVVRSNEYGTYVAVAIQVKNLNYPKT
jgi:hypothetical protein